MGTQTVVEEVIDRNYLNATLYRSDFIYTSDGSKVVKINRYDKTGTLISIIYNGGSYYEVVQVVKVVVLGWTTTTYKSLGKIYDLGPNYFYSLLNTVRTTFKV